MSRRQFSLSASAALLMGSAATVSRAKSSFIGLVLAPSNLGLRPDNGRQPGTWQAPQVLMDAGLAEAIGAAEVIRLKRPAYQFEAQADTRIRNGRTIRDFSFQLADTVRGQIQAGRFPVVVGGDCSILLGCLYGARRAGGRGLVHVDGHSDFAQASSYATPQTLGAAAGMDLALVSGRGEKLLTEWPDIEGALAADADTVQVGERDQGTPGFDQYYGEILKTEIMQITAQRVHAEGTASVARAVVARLETRGLDRAWLHVDLDVLDEKVMAAVDSPGSPGFDYGQLADLVGRLVDSGLIIGANFSIYDPDRDPGHAHAPDLVACIAASIRPRVAVMEALRA